MHLMNYYSLVHINNYINVNTRSIPNTASNMQTDTYTCINMHMIILNDRPYNLINVSLVLETAEYQDGQGPV